MKKKDLVELLSKYPDDIEIVVAQYSDYVKLDESSVYEVDAVDKGCWVMRAHNSMSEENKQQQKSFLLVGGY
jgi:hypothetical protein